MAFDRVLWYFMMPLQTWRGKRCVLEVTQHHESWVTGKTTIAWKTNYGLREQGFIGHITKQSPWSCTLHMIITLVKPIDSFNYLFKKHTIKTYQMPCIILDTEDKMVKIYIFLCSRILEVMRKRNQDYRSLWCGLISASADINTEYCSSSEVGYLLR